VDDEAVHRELGDIIERAATIASNLEAEQDSVNTLGSGEDSMQLMELMAHCTKLSALDDDVTLVNETKEIQDDELMFDTRVLDIDEMLVEAKVDEKDEQSTKLDDSTASKVVTTASVEGGAAPTTIEEIT
ncbi:hypothetical protein Tco_0118143, partial [Tanacetum coccineum]